MYRKQRHKWIIVPPYAQSSPIPIAAQSGLEKYDIQ